VTAVADVVWAFNDFYGRRADGKLIKAIVPQFDGSARGGDNCAPASEAARAIRNQYGVRPLKGSPWQPTGASIRAASDDRSGGMTPSQTTAVTRRVYGIDADIRIAYWSEINAWLRKGGTLTLLVRYLPIAQAGKSGSPGFYGNHSIPIIGIRGTGTGIEYSSGDPLYCGRRPGIPEGAQWLTVGTVKKAAAQLELSAGVTMAQRYPGQAYVVFSTKTWNPPPPELPFRLLPATISPGAKRLLRPRVYTPTRNLYMRRTPKLLSTNRITTVGPGFEFEAYQYIVNQYGKWIGNKRATAWLLFDSVKFVRYL
jgi:hypothetical protein